MENSVKLKKRLKKLQQNISHLQTIVHTPIPITPVDEASGDPKQLRKSMNRCQTAVPKVQTKRGPESSKRRSTSVQGIRPMETKGDVGSLSMNKLCCKPTRNESVIKRTASKIAIIKQPKQFLNKEKSSIQPKKSSIIYIKKARPKPKRLRELIKSSSSKDMKSLRHDCHAIEIVFDGRKRTDKLTRLNNIHILGKLYLLITFGDLEESQPHARQLLKDASAGTVRLISRLTCSCQKSKDLANSVLEAVKIICVKKPALTFMSTNERVIHLIIDMTCLSGKKALNNKGLLATLARIASDSNGLKIISKNEIFYKLFYYFRKEDKYKHVQHRLGKIKAYSILNRAVTLIILPTLRLKMDLYLPENVQKCLEEETVSDESEPENEESEEDTDDDDDSDDADTATTTDISSLKKSTGDSAKSYEACTDELLTEMSPFYVESLLASDDTEYASIFKFDIYEGIIRLTNTRIIENRVHRGLNNDIHAYPDAVMLEPEFDEHTWNVFVNNFSRECMANKLKCSRGILQSTYIPRVVYDLDELYGKRRQPIIVPHPTTFVPNKTYDRNQASMPNSLKFESRFECGNLRKALQIERYEYELLLTPDTNTTKGLQWFYFQVSNIVPGITYTFNIANFLKFNSQHNYGMQPLMFSAVDYKLNKTGWQRVGEEIIYFGNNYTDERGDRQYRTLCFSVTFPYPNDYVYFAYHYPYTFTRLMIKLFPFVNYKMDEIYARMDKLCTTVKTRNEIALLTITGAWNRANSLGIPLRRRPLVFITARVHPGETNASWIMEGIINFLLHPTDPDAVIAREHFIFKIIPMLNPEGVIYGNTRNGLTGSDLNRCWARPNKITCPEIYYVKRLIACAKKQLKLPVAAYIDIHGHSRKRYFFFYGCNPKMSWNKKDKANGNLLDTLKILPEMVHDINPNIRLAQCKYKITKNRESTGRVVMWRQFDIKHSYTLECSYSFASDKQSVNTKILSEIGASVITSLGKLAEKAYNARKGVPSLALDYTYIDSIRAVEKRVEDRLKEGADESATYPLFVNSRVLQTTTVINRNP